MTPPRSDLARRVRRAREALGLSQQDLARRLGVHLNTVQGWEAGRRPRGEHRLAVEHALGIDLDAAPESSSPTLDEATDAQIIASLAGRLAERERTIAELRQQLAEEDTSHGTVVAPAGRWAARTRRNPDTHNG